jgi:hypothetical protein
MGIGEASKGQQCDRGELPRAKSWEKYRGSIRKAIVAMNVALTLSAAPPPLSHFFFVDVRSTDEQPAS